jgi:hypothetical protein
MRRTVLTIMALAFMVVAYGSTALGADSATEQGQIRFVRVNPCVVAFAFKGFEPGTMGRLEVQMNGTVYRTQFPVPAPSGGRAWNLHDILGDPHPPTIVQFRVEAGGVTLAGRLNCDCGPGGGGSGGGSGGNGGTGATTASAASAVTSQPGFAG